MTRKTIKDLDAELTLLKKELSDLKTKCEILEEKYAECRMNRKTFKCNDCDADFMTK